MTNAQHTPGPWEVVAGLETYAALQAEKEKTVPHSTRPGMEHCYASDHLCAWQAKCHTFGYEGARLVESIYGWGLRYESGLNNFAVIAGARPGDVLDGSLEAAIAYAEKWCADSPKHRYVMGYREELDKARAAIAKAKGGTV